MCDEQAMCESTQQPVFVSSCQKHKLLQPNQRALMAMPRPQPEQTWITRSAALQRDRDRQAVPPPEFLQAELLHPVEPDAANGEQWAKHGVCHPALLPTVPV